MDDCSDLARAFWGSWEWSTRFTNDRLLCGVMDATFLKNALRAMPRLRSVCLSLSGRELHGIDWDLLEAILSTPHLRKFTLMQYLLSPRGAPTGSDVGSIAPITSFRYDQSGSRWKLFDYPSQEQTLALVIQNLRAALEDLALPMELASSGLFSYSRWPRLRTLHLKGAFQACRSAHVPFVSLFSGMPELRVLNLELGLPPGTDSQLLHLWPQGYTASRLPWENLEDLTVPFAHQDDQVYTHPPRSLRHLSLRWLPRYSMQPWHGEHVSSHQYPMRRASELLEILGRVKAPRLDRILLEYCADAAEDELLQYVVEKFPDLTSLEIHRYPQPNDEDLPVVSPRSTRCLIS